MGANAPGDETGVKTSSVELLRGRWLGEHLFRDLSSSRASLLGSLD